MKYVICIDNEGYEAALEKQKIYQVKTDVSLPEGLISVIDESGEDYIYDKEYFAPVEVDQELKPYFSNKL